MKKYLLIASLILSVIGLSSFSKTALADGMVIKPDPYSNRWDYSAEDSQKAYINYDNGLQKMILSIGLNSENNDGAVWLFPVPAEPNKVVIDVVSDIPYLGGEDISIKAKLGLSNSIKALQSSQIYPIPFVLNSTRYSTSKGSDIALTADSISNGAAVAQDVAVYEHIDKKGIISEIITAKTAKGLYEYLISKNLKVDEGSIPVLENYIGKDYSFVVSWISKPTLSSQQNSSSSSLCGIRNVIEGYRYCDDQGDNYYNQRGVFVTFPTDDIYFPLLPTSVYGSKSVPATIKIIGHVTPEVFQDIKSYTKTSYYIDSQSDFSSSLKTFYNGKSENIKYTKIEIDAPSKSLTADLWIDRQAPLKTYYSSFISENIVLVTGLALMASSMLSSIAAGLFLFKLIRKDIRKLALIGLFNCFSILGLIVATLFVGTKPIGEDEAALIAEIKRKGYVWRRIAAVALFAIAAVTIVFGFLMISYGSEMMDLPFIEYMSNPMTAMSIIYLIPFIGIVLGNRFMQIKLKDKDMFIKLDELGYSNWSFRPKDPAKLLFVPMFSIVFLGISWLLIKLIELFV